MRRYIDKATLLALINEYGIDQEFEAVLSKAQIEDKYKYRKLNLTDIKQLCDKINNSKFKQVNRPESYKTPLWMKGQFKLFIWVSVYYSFNLDISIKQFKKKDFQVLNDIFVEKTVERLRYELKSMLNTQIKPRKKWQHQEIQFLKQILRRYEDNQKKPEWKSIAFELFLNSNGTYLRTFGQCRQMFINHLSKNVRKDKWTEEQDELLMHLVQIYDKKWSKISEMFEGQRSGHMIKNRYVTLTRRRVTVSEQVSPNQTIKSSSQVKIQQESQRKDLSPKLPLMIYGKEIQTESFDNSEDKSMELYKRPSLFVESFSFLQLPIMCQLPFKNMNELTLNPIEIAKFFNENRLCEHLGCSHYEQIQEAFEEDHYFEMDFEQ